MLLYKREMKRNLKSFLIWAAVFVCYNIMMFALFPAMVQQGESIKQMIANMPKEFLKAFNAENMDPSNIMSFFAVYSYLYFLLSGAVYAMILSGGILSREEGEKTIEFLMAKPITRISLVTQKLACTLTYLTLFAFSYFSSAYVMIQIEDNNTFNSRAFFMMALGSILLLWTFVSIGILLSAVLTKARSVTPTALGLVLGCFVLGIFSGLDKKVEVLKYLSPFQYVDSGYIMEHEALNGLYMLIMIALIVVSLIAAYLRYNKKDIQA